MSSGSSLKRMTPRLEQQRKFGGIKVRVYCTIILGSSLGVERAVLTNAFYLSAISLPATQLICWTIHDWSLHVWLHFG